MQFHGVDLGLDPGISPAAANPNSAAAFVLISLSAYLHRANRISQHPHGTEKGHRKADANESKGNRDPISSDDAVTFVLEEQEKKEAKRLKRGASTSTSASRKSRKSDEVASSLSQHSKPSFIQEYSAEDSEEESSDDENKNTCYKQKGRSKKDDSDEDDDVIAAMKGDLCDNTKTALTIMASNPVLASMFRVAPGKIARALKKHKSSRAIADAFEPIPACPGDGQMVPYVAHPLTLSRKFGLRI